VPSLGLAEQQDVYLASFARFESERPGNEQPWLRRLRRDALQRFAELGFPSTHLEEWKQTNVAPLAKIPFRLAADGHAGVAPAALARVTFPDVFCRRLAFVNGHFSPELSHLSGLPPGVKVVSLRTAFAQDEKALEEHLARYARFDNQAFVALNTAFMQDGAFVEIPRGTVFQTPIHLLYLSTGSNQPTVLHPRNLILVGPNSQISVIESYFGLGNDVYFTNAVTEIVVADNSELDHYKLQQESQQAFHISTLQVRQASNSRFHSHSISLGGALVRNEVKPVLDAEGAECMLNGLYQIANHQHVDNHTTLDHAKPHGTSRELYKGILSGQATAVFNGRIIVRKDAQKTDAIQRNKNLLLSKNAVIDTKPQLEIYANDVRCTHGATIGQLDQEAMFYLRSRGISEQAARHLLIAAFAAEIVDEIKIEAVHDWLRAIMTARLFTNGRVQEEL
jgi:Fe-S cluster assembly protein SufD